MLALAALLPGLPVHAQSLAAPAPAVATGSLPAAPTAPFGVAVLPFADRRHPGQSSWLGVYLRERIARALLRSPQVAVLSDEAAALWPHKLGLEPGTTPTGAQLGAMGVQAVVVGATQEVLELADVELHVYTAEGDRLAGDAGTLRIALGAEPPPVALRRVLGVVQEALLPGSTLAEPLPPADWEAVQQLYEILAEPLPADDPRARPARVARLRPWLQHPALGHRVQEALAGLLLEQALRYEPQGPARQAQLGEALRLASAAALADPRDTRREALLAELHVFLRQYDAARTEASIARLRNPLESLAYVVQAMAAGLSTGEANEALGRALAMDPFLRADARPPGSAAFQAGILEEPLRRWEALHSKGGLARPDDTAELLAAGIAHFNHQQWEDAEATLRRVAERDDADYTARLYLNRILIELGHPERAVTSLQRLADANPQEFDILYWLATAMDRSGSPQAARDTYHKALLERPDDAPSQFGLAGVEMTLGHWPEALTALRSVLHGQPENAQAWLRLGIVDTHLEDWPAAEGALQRALELEPDSAEARQRLAEVRRKLGKPEPPDAGAASGPARGAAAPPQGPPAGGTPGAGPRKVAPR